MLLSVMVSRRLDGTTNCPADAIYLSILDLKIQE
jgi:hypothetical protein